MAQTPIVILFDVDGTLVNTGGRGRASMRGAFDELWHGASWLNGVSFGGMTDHGIVRAGLQVGGVEASLELIERTLEVYLKHLEKALVSAEVEVPEHVETTLKRMQPGSHEHIAVGLGTGNVQTGARLKLAAASIEYQFAFGGFGCDAEDRSELLRIGGRRGAQRLGVGIEDCQVVVVGDTPRDIVAAKQIDARCFAVATGGYSVEQLLEHEPDHVAETMEAFPWRWIE